MFKFNRILFLAAVMMSAHAPISQADDSYISKVPCKFTRGFSNLFTGIGEVPKNIVDASKKTNPVVGFTGGLVMGTLDTLGRTASGIYSTSLPVLFQQNLWFNPYMSGITSTNAHRMVMPTNKS